MTDIPRINEDDPSKMPDGHWIDREGWEVCIKNGNYHRNDGPAVIYPDGTVFWCLDDEWYPFDEWLEANKELTEEQKVMLKLEYG